MKQPWQQLLVQIGWLHSTSISRQNLHFWHGFGEGSAGSLRRSSFRRWVPIVLHIWSQSASNRKSSNTTTTIISKLVNFFLGLWPWWCSHWEHSESLAKHWTQHRLISWCQNTSSRYHLEFAGTWAAIATSLGTILQTSADICYKFQDWKLEIEIWTSPLVRKECKTRNRFGSRSTT